MIEQILITLARAIELVGVAAIVLGILVATLIGLRDLAARGQHRQVFERYRANLGRGILLGLELLVAADIIATVTAPLSWESLGLLGLLIIIRTFLSFSLETEIEGVFPWARRRYAEGDAQER